MLYKKLNIILKTDLERGVFTYSAGSGCVMHTGTAVLGALAAALIMNMRAY